MHSRGKGPGKGPGKGLGKGPGEGPDMTPARVPGSALARAIQGPKGSGKIPGKGARKGPGILPKQSHLPSALGLAVGAAPAQAIARSAPGAAALSYAVGVPTKPQGPESDVFYESRSPPGFGFELRRGGAHKAPGASILHTCFTKV